MFQLARASLRSFLISSASITARPRAIGLFTRVPIQHSRKFLFPQIRRTFASENETPVSTAAITEKPDTQPPSQPEVTDLQDAGEQVTNTTSSFGFGDRNRSRDLEPSTTLYVGNVFFEVTDDQLKREFERIGEVKSATILTDRRGLSKGYGYVEFTDQADAAKAIETLHQQTFEGRRMVVQYHIKRQFSNRVIRPDQPPSKTLFIGNLSFEMSDRDLNDLFREIRNVLDVRVAIDRRSGQPRGFAHADFIDIKSAEQAREILEGKEIYGRKLRVDFSNNSRDNTRSSRPE